MCERIEKMLGRPALCIDLHSDLITYLITMVIFLKLLRRKLPFGIFMHKSFLTLTGLDYGSEIVRNSIKIRLGKLA